jgi:hypothetical protein
MVKIDKVENGYIAHYKFGCIKIFYTFQELIKWLESYYDEKSELGR